MYFKRRVIADADHFSLKWAPVLLRFFQLFVGIQSVAETLTIETLAEHIRNSGTTSDEDTEVRRACVNAVGELHRLLARSEFVSRPSQSLSGQVKTGQRWSLQNRPTEVAED